MKNRKNILSLLTISAFTLISLAACAGNTVVKSAAPLPEEEGEKEEFGITQRENDLDDYEDLRPDRDGFEDTTEPDSGELVDHIFEFEEMASSGFSRDKDHLCSAVSYVTSAEFSGNIAVECVDIGTAFNLNITSDKAVKIPMVIGLSNNQNPGGILGDIVKVKNNGRAVFDEYALVSAEGNPAEGAPSGYFDMVAVESTLSLFEGENRITFTLAANQVNLDYVNLKTSASIVNKTVSSWDTPKFEVVSTPTEKQGGALKITCGHEDCPDKNYNDTRYLPKLTDSCYKVVEESEYIKAYYISLVGQELLVARTDNSPSEQFPEDTGSLKDNFFEFEKAKIDGVSQDEAHLCPGKSLVFSADFSDGLCVEALEKGTKMSFVINSDKRVRAPFEMKVNNYHGGAMLADRLSGTNNGEAKLVDLSGIIPTDGKYANVGDLTPYFNMVTVEGTIDLVEGENIIEFQTKATGLNFDYLNIKTSATLANSTVTTWSGENAPTFEVTKQATFLDKGEVKVKCPIGGTDKCERIYNYIPALRDPSYITEVEGTKTNYYIEAFGTRYLIGTIEGTTGGEFPLDNIGVKEHKFEFESSAVTGNSQKMDHWCASKSLVFSTGFSNNFCLENTGLGTTFSFTINSDKAVQVAFELTATNSIANKPLNSMLVFKNNGKEEMVDASRTVPGTGFTPDVGDLSIWFNMVTGVGTINLVKGENKIEITTADNGVNPDCINIFSSANLVNNTVPTWSGANVPNFTITKSPSATEKGTMEIKCPSEVCAEAPRQVNYLPTLDNPAYELIENSYCLNILGTKVEVAKKEA